MLRRYGHSRCRGAAQWASYRDRQFAGPEKPETAGRLLAVS